MKIETRKFVGYRLVELQNDLLTQARWVKKMVLEEDCIKIGKDMEQVICRMNEIKDGLKKVLFIIREESL